VFDVPLATARCKTFLLRTLNDSSAGRNQTGVVMPIEEEEELRIKILFADMDIEILRRRKNCLKNHQKWKNCIKWDTVAACNVTFRHLPGHTKSRQPCLQSLTPLKFCSVN
jgi:hypothetical protein